MVRSFLKGRKILSRPEESSRRLKNSGLFAFSLALSLIAGLSSSWGSETETFKKADSGKEITVRAGDVIRIELQQAGATGYLWDPHDLDTEHFEVVCVETRAAVTPEITGAPVVKIWSIKGLKEGKSEMRFFYYRPWKDIKNALDQFVLKVRILK